MIKNFFSARLLVAALCVFAGLSIRAATVAHWTNMPEGSKNYGCTIGNYGEGSGATLNKDGSVRLTKQEGGNPNTGIEITMPENFVGDNLSILVGYEGLDRPSANIAYLEIQTADNKKVLAAGNSNNTIYVSTFEGDAGSTHSQGVHDNTSLNAPTEGWMYVSLDRSRNFRFGFISLDGTHTAVHERQITEGYANGFKKILVGGSTAAIGKYWRIGARIKEIAILQDVAFEALSPSEMLSGESLTKISDINSLSKDFPSIGFENDATIQIDKALECVAVNITTESALTFVRSEDISDDIVADIMKKLQINGKSYSFISKFQDTIKFEDGVVALEETNVAEVFVCEGYTDKLYGVKGGTLVKEGEGTLSSVLVDNATIDIDDGKLIFDEGNGTLAITNATFVLSSSAELNNHGWISAGGTLTFKSDANVTVFSNTARNTDYANTSVFTTNSHPDIEKDGTGRIELRIGADNKSRNIINKVTVSDGTLAFGGSEAKVISEVEGTGTLEQAGGGAMTILSSVSSDTSLYVSAGTLNNTAENCNTLKSLKVASGATYSPSGTKFSITKELYLEGAHNTWWVTLDDNALIATNPQNPMELAALDFGENVILGKDHAVGSVLAKLDGRSTLPTNVKSDDGRFSQIDFGLDYIENELIVTRRTGSDAAATIIPGIDLFSGSYRVEMTLPEDFDREKGDLYIHIIMPDSSDDVRKLEKDANNKWYATLDPDYDTNIGQLSQLTVELGVVDGGKFIPVDKFDNITLNVRPDASKKNWINEPAYQRWDTGTWDAESDSDYITLSNGYVQVEGKTIRFSPNYKGEEVAAKLHFEAKFGEAMDIKVLNAITDEESKMAGIGLVEAEDGAIGYAAWDPSAKKYVLVSSSSMKPIDFSAEHLVEIAFSTNSVAYSIDGAALVTNGEKKSAVFALPVSKSVHIEEICFEGTGAIKSMTAEEYSTKLAEYNKKQYATIEDAIAEANKTNSNRIEITPLWDANWSPEFDEALTNKLIVFTGNYKVFVDESNLNETDYVLRPEEGGNKYMLISKYLTITIRDPEEVNNGFGVFLESVATNSMHLGWVYDYNKSSVAKATIVYNDDVTISFSNTLDNGANGALLVAREGAEDGEGNAITAGTQVKSVTFHQVRYDTEVVSKHIPVLGGENMDSVAKAKVKALYDYGIAAPKAMTADINIIDFTAASDGVTFNIAALDGVSDAEKIAAVSNLVWFSTDLKNWKLVADDGIRINEDGSITVKQVGSTGFYKVSIR